MSIYVTTDVPTGTELTLSSIHGTFYSDAATRAARVHATLTPPCMCPAFDPSHPQFPMHERIRRTLRFTVNVVDNSLDHHDIVPDDLGIGPTSTKSKPAAKPSSTCSSERDARTSRSLSGTVASSTTFFGARRLC
jgi:hypothetical protein